MKRDRTVAPGSTIEDGGAMLVSPSRVSETGSGTGRSNVAVDPQASDRAGGEGGSLSGRTACYTALPTSLLNSGMVASHGTASPAAVFAAAILLNSWRE